MQRPYRESFQRIGSGISNLKVWNIIITSECLKLLMGRVQIGKNEDCGVLFASQISDDCIRINSISDSCCFQNESSKCSCKLDIEKANTAISEEFEKSNHTRFYIGEWHTHPEDYPTPSSRDYRSLKDSFHKNELVIPNLIIMAIVGRKAICWKMFDGNVIRDIVI